MIKVQVLLHVRILDLSHPLDHNIVRLHVCHVFEIIKLTMGYDRVGVMIADCVRYPTISILIAFTLQSLKFGR
jgi:hypothetical protein